jgi:hypothetical protein
MAMTAQWQTAANGSWPAFALSYLQYCERGVDAWFEYCAEVEQAFFEEFGD